MTGPSSKAVEKTPQSSFHVTNFVVAAAIAWVLVILFLLQGSPLDPYVKSTIELQGSQENGERLFRVNCVGCHGINASGLLGPDLHDVTLRLNDQKIIKQVVQGKTPPMPSFELEPQSMADLLAHMHSLN